jgi:hypothetical protein
MGDQEPFAHRLIVECRSDSVYVVEDAETGIRLAGRDFDQLQRAVREAAALLCATDPKQSGSIGHPVEDRPSRWALLSRVPRSLVLLAPVLLGGLLLLTTLRSYAQIGNLVPDGTAVFRNLRLSVLKIDRALQDIEPRNRDELRASIRSIVTSLKPYADDIRPLFEDQAGTAARQRGRSPQPGAP